MTNTETVMTHHLSLHGEQLGSSTAPRRLVAIAGSLGASCALFNTRQVAVVLVIAASEASPASLLPAGEAAAVELLLLVSFLVIVVLITFNNATLIYHRRQTI